MSDFSCAFVIFPIALLMNPLNITPMSVRIPEKFPLVQDDFFGCLQVFSSIGGGILHSLSDIALPASVLLALAVVSDATSRGD